MANRRYTQFSYSHHNKMVTLHTKFTILSTNGAGCTGFTQPGGGTFGGPTTTVGFGLGIAQVYAYSSAPSTGNYVPSGGLQIQLNDPFLSLLDFDFCFSNVVTGSAVLLTTGLVAGTQYQITTVGTSTAANWQAVGLPAGLVPTVGQNFIASTATAGTGTGAVKALAPCAVSSVELCGDVDLQINPQMSQLAQGFNGGAGPTLNFGLYRSTTLQQPANGTVVLGRLCLSSSGTFG